MTIVVVSKKLFVAFTQLCLIMPASKTISLKYMELVTQPLYRL